METTPATSTATNAVLVEKGIFAENIDQARLSNLLHQFPEAFAWWVTDFEHPELPAVPYMGDSELKLLLSPEGAGSPRSTLRAGRLPVQRVAGAQIVRTVRLSFPNRLMAQNELHMPVSLATTNRVIICLVQPSEVQRVTAILKDNTEQLMKGGVETALALLLLDIVESYDLGIFGAADFCDDLANRLFMLEPLEGRDQLASFRVQASLSRMLQQSRRLRAIIGQVATPKTVTNDATVTAQWELIQAEIDDVVETLESLRRNFLLISDTNAVLAENLNMYLNRAMRRLAGWGAIVAVPALVSGFVGMNVNFPLSGTDAGFYFYLVIMIVAIVLIYIFFHRKRWI
jgi:magnesium transporter